MKAVTCSQYGPPEVLQLRDVAKPTPKDNEILIKVHATTVTTADLRVRKFDVPPMFWIPGRLALGMTKPKNEILGSEIAGDVEAVGANVTRFKVGDPVIAHSGHTMGGYAEYCCVLDDKYITRKPENLTYEEAAATTFGGLTALNFLREAHIQPGQTILVNGASGAVGTYVVQLAKTFGAQVTAICSGKNADLVCSLGADRVIDYTQQDFTKIGETFDIFFDVVGNTTVARCKHLLKPGGVFLHAVMVASEIKTPWFKRTTGLKVVGGTPEGEANALPDLIELIASGKIKPVIDRCYPLEQIVEAHRYADTGHKRGNLVIAVA